MFKRFGYLAVGTYLGVYVCTLSSLYVMVSCGLIQGPDVNAFLNAWSVKKALYGPEEIRLADSALDFGVAWVLTKTTEPVRAFVTIALVPLIARRAPPAVLRFFRVTPAAGLGSAAASAEASVGAAAGVGAAVHAGKAAGPSPSGSASAAAAVAAGAVASKAASTRDSALR